MKIYGISGLGANERVFDHLNQYLKDPIEYVPWLTPHKNETLVQYAHRMAEQLPSSEDFALVGLSFGGMISSEIRKIRRPKKTILLSSAACKDELPLLYRGAGKVQLTKLIPANLMRAPHSLLHFGMSLKKEENKHLMDSIMEETDRDFLKWAVGAITTWDAIQPPEDVVRIHGDKDRIIPLKVKADHLISGGHMIVMEEAELVSKAITESLALS